MPLPSRAATALTDSVQAGTILIQLIGSPRLTLAGSPPRPLERKLAAALALAARGTGLSRERVAGLLWPGSGDSTARTNLRVLLHRAKESTGVQLLASGPGWALAAGVSCDLLLPGSDTLRHPVLDGCHFDDLEELRIELDALQARLRGHVAAGSLAEAEVALLSGTRDGHQRAASLTQAILVATPVDEPACRLLMKAQIALGQRNAALASYERLRSALSDTLGTQPDRQTRLLQLDILRDHAQAASPAAAVHAEESPLDPLRSPQAVGRQGVIEQLLALGAQSRHAWLEADAGVGKSRVVEELLLRTAAVRVRCRPSDGSKAYAVLRRLIGQIEMERPAETQATMAELLKPGRAGSGIDLHDVFDGVVETLTRLKRDGVNQLVVEDVHYLDAASGRLINELGEAMTDDRALAVQLPAFVFTARPHHDNPTFSTLRQAVQADPNVQRIALPPLTPAETKALVQALAPAQPWLAAPDLAARLHAMSGGNAFFTLEIIRAAIATPDPCALAVRVDSVQQLLARRLQDASPEALDLASLLAVAQADFDPRMPREILGQDGRSMARAWQELVGLGIFRSGGFAHDLALAAAQDALVGPQAQLVHAQVGEFIERHGGSDERIAHHYLRSPAPARAVGAVLRFAQAMSREGTAESAIALAADAEQRVPDLEYTEDGFTLLAKLALWWTNDARRLLDFVPGALRRLSNAARTPEQQLLARTLDWTALRFKPLGDRDVARELETLWQEPRLWPWWHWIAALLISRLQTSGTGAGKGESARTDELLACVEAEHARWPESVMDLAQIGISLTNLIRNDEQNRRIRTLIAAWETLAHRSAAKGVANALSYMSVQGCSKTEGYEAAARRMDAVLPHFERRGVIEGSRNSAREWRRFFAGRAGLFNLAWQACSEAALRRDEVGHPFVAAEADIFLAHGLGDLAGVSALVAEHPAVKRPASERQSKILSEMVWMIEEATAQAEQRLPSAADLGQACRPHVLDADVITDCALAGAALQARAELELSTPAVQASSLRRWAWTFKLLQAHLQQDRLDAAQRLLASLLPMHPAWPGDDALTAPDSACALWLAMSRCGHPEAAAHRATWSRWRDEQLSQLPPEWHASFRWRHAWVSDTPALRPARVPRGPWVRD